MSFSQVAGPILIGFVILTMGFQMVVSVFFFLIENREENSFSMRLFRARRSRAAHVAELESGEPVFSDPFSGNGNKLTIPLNPGLVGPTVVDSERQTITARQPDRFVQPISRASNRFSAVIRKPSLARINRRTRDLQDFEDIELQPLTKTEGMYF